MWISNLENESILFVARLTLYGALNAETSVPAEDLSMQICKSDITLN